MKKLLIVAVFVLLPLIIPGTSLGIEVGDHFHVTGCKDGELLVPIIHMWSKPGGGISGAKVIGKLSGDGRADQNLRCQGSVVELLELKIDDNKLYLKVKSVVGSKTGWITDSFVGRKTTK